MKTTTPSLQVLAKVIGDAEALGLQHEAFYFTEAQIQQLRKEARAIAVDKVPSTIFGVPIVLVTEDEQWHMTRVEIQMRGFDLADIHRVIRGTLAKMRAAEAQ